MKLLTKNQIIEVKNKERQLDIEQGMSFARKIDALREAKESEEVALNKFRSDTSDALKKETESLVSKRDLLCEEVKTLEEKKLTALKPLTEEWNKVKDRENQLTILERSLSEAFIKSEANKAYLFEKNKELARDLNEIKVKLDATDKAYKETIEYKETSKLLLENAKVKSQEILSKVESSLRNVFQRETSVGAREYNVNIREQNQDKRELELNAKETAINDKYQTLQRTINRLKK